MLAKPRDEEHLGFMASPRGIIALRLTVSTLLGASSLGAQTARGNAPAVDSTGVANPWPQHAWISVGLGGGTSPRGAISALATGWYSAGVVALGVRLADADQLFGEQRSDRALLVGARTRGNRWFLLGAAGIADIASSHTCDACTALTRPPVTEVAYSVEGHGNLTFVGIGVTMFGALGPVQARYNAIALTLNVGTFGR